MEIEKEMKYKEVTSTNFITLKSKNITEDYEIKEKISNAAFGDIYKVYHKITKSIRCLKLYVKDKMKNSNQN